MRKERQLIPRTTLFGKVIVYECNACGRMFPISLLDGAVSAGLSPPTKVIGDFISHTCERHKAQLYAACSLHTARYRCLGSLMALNDEDVPASYLVYVVVVTMVMAVLAVGAFFFFLR